jgi:glyoxylase-like metal-dependent hydrolase (beta-lactamase superfamily II)
MLRDLGDGVHQIALLPRSGVNAYFAGGVLFDAGIPSNAKKILTALKGHEVTAHTLTHGHPDHQGASHAVCESLNIPLCVGDADADAVEAGDLRPLMPASLITSVMSSMAGPAHAVSRRLREGDEIGGFQVIETPGHSPGHVVYYCPDNGVLILGDVLTNMHVVTTLVGLREPPRPFTPDPALNRKSAKKLIGLKPELVLFGHGPPLAQR